MRHLTRPYGTLRATLLACAALFMVSFCAACEDEATPCTTNDDCALGETCVEELCESTGEPFVIAALPNVAVAPEATGVITVKVPADAQSMALVVDGAGSELILADHIEGPEGVVVFDWNSGVTLNRSDATDGLYTVVIPNNPDVELTAGEWSFAMRTSGDTFDGTVKAILKAEEPADNVLDLNLFFVGVAGLDAASAPGDADFQEIMGNVEAVYQDAGFSFGGITYSDVTGANADKFQTIDTTESPNGELYQLFALSNTVSNRALNFFFVADIAGSDGFSLLGLSGGVPGPPGIHGTLRSGVAVNMADFIAAREGGDPAALAEAKGLTELIMAHEGGHYLGLYHTTERNGMELGDGIHGQDHLSDTPVCPDSADANGNSVLSASECAGHDSGNLMFWSPESGSRTLTSSQQSVLHRNPLVR